MDNHIYFGMAMGVALAVGPVIFWFRVWVKKLVADEIGKLKQFSVAELKAVEQDPTLQKCDWCAHLVVRWAKRADGRIACLNCQHDHGV